MSMKKIPAGLEELSGVKAWLCYAESYDSSKHHGTGGYSKLPFSALSLRSVGWEHNLSDFATAAGRIGQAIPGAKVKTKPRRDSPSQIVPAVVSGIGFYLPKSGYICIDLDEVYNGTYGTLTEEASQIVRICGSYTEISPSWRGLHIIVRAEGAPDFSVWDTSQAKGKPDTRGGTAGEYQILPGYMTVTGQAHIRSQPLRALTPEEWAQLSAFFTRPAKPEPVTSPAAGASSVTSSGSPSPSQVLRAQPQAVSGDGSLTQSERLERWQELLPTLSDDDLLTRIFKANHKAEDLFTNAWSGYGYESSSEADAALLALFLSYTQDTETAKRLFKQSKLYQGDKDPKQRGDAYINLTLRSVEVNGISPLAGFIDFTRDDRRNYAIGHEAPLAWPDEAAGAPSVTSSGQAQPSAQSQARAPQGSVLRQVQAAAQTLTGPIDWEKARGAYFDPSEEEIPEGFPFSTGLPNVDEVIGGGIFPYVYTLGAISSLGKTSLAVQIADYVAGHGRPVLYFSLEMNKKDLRAKSLSRRMYLLAEKETKHASVSFGAYTSTEVLFPSTRHKDTGPTAEDLTARLERAKNGYIDEEGRNIYYITGTGSIRADYLVQTVETFMDLHPDWPQPFVVVDYLQILAAEDPHDTDKIRVDKATLKLVTLSHDKHVPMLAISSFNRDSYSSPVTESAYKESGTVEYSADVLMGLQPQGMQKGSGPSVKAANLQCCEDCKRSPDVRHIELKVLKTRLAPPLNEAKLEYRPGFNLFREDNSGFVYKPSEGAETVTNDKGQGTGGPSGNNGRGAPQPGSRKGGSRSNPL